MSTQHYMRALSFLLIPILLSSQLARAENVRSTALGSKKARVVSIVRGTGAGSDKATGFVTHFMRARLETDDRYELVPVDRALGSPDDPQQVLTRSSNLFAQGREAYDSLDLDQAIEHLNGALRELERRAYAVHDIRQVSDILMLLGATHILRSEEIKGRERLAQAMTFNPQIDPDPAIFNPNMRTIFKSAQAIVNKARKGSIAVSTIPSYGEVFVDGRFVGIAPVTIDLALEGRHYVRVIRDGYREFGTVLAVKGTSEISEVAELAPAPKLDEYDHLVNLTVDARNEVMQRPSAAKANEDVLTLASQLGVLLGVEQVFLTDVRLDGERVLLRTTQFDLTTDEKMKSATHAFTYDAVAATYQRETEVMLDRHFAPETLTEQTDGAIFYGRWSEDRGLVHAGSDVCMGASCQKFKKNVLLFGGIGSGALLVTGGIFAILGRHNNSVYRDSPQGSPEADSAYSSGRTQALVGDICLGIGIAGAVTTAVLYFFYEPAPSAEDVMSNRVTSAPRLLPHLDIGPTAGGASGVATWHF
ncbi:MAG: PEGA domain-containing protein [Clostridia bacterium]|nr:PEGA domain-containing protein [Deltaproteobacteria bacterium]